MYDNCKCKWYITESANVKYLRVNQTSPSYPRVNSFIEWPPIAARFKRLSEDRVPRSAGEPQSSGPRECKMADAVSR